MGVVRIKHPLELGLEEEAGKGEIHERQLKQTSS
jgi:hypothetical protein